MSMKADKARARHILVEQEYEAQDLLRKLKEGVAFAELAKKYSRCPSREQGGDLGVFARGRMVEAFEEATFALQENEISQPIRTRFGYHLIQRLPHE